MCKLDAPVKGAKASLRDSNKKVQKTIEKLGLKMTKPNSTLPKYPTELGYLVEWARQLHGAESLTFTELKNWSDLMQIKLNSWEVDLLVRLDSVYHKAMRSEA